MKALLVLLVAAVVVGVGGAGASAQAIRSQASAAVILLDSRGKVAARPFSETVVLVTDEATGVVAPATIRPVYGDDQRTASGWATWQSGGSALYTSADCTAGAHVFSTGKAGLRATAQVRTADGVVLHVGAIGPTVTATIRSILSDSGCSPVTVRQNGLLPVDVTINLTVRYPPPLSFQ